MLSIKDYAKSKNVSYEAVRKQINRYKTELDGHLVKENRTNFLDDYAIEFLDNKRKSNPIVIMENSKDEELEQLQNENKALLLKVAELQDQLLKEKDEVKVLQEEKIQLLEQKNQAENDEQKLKKHWWNKFL